MAPNKTSFNLLNLFTRSAQRALTRSKATPATDRPNFRLGNQIKRATKTLIGVEDLPHNVSISKFADKYNLTLKSVSDRKTGEEQLFSVAPEDVDRFWDQWGGAYNVIGNTSQDDLLQEYDLIDENMIEASLMLDTYTDEILSVGFNENPIKIYVENNTSADKKLQEVLVANNVNLQFHRKVLRGFLKYGNYGVKVYNRKGEDTTIIDTVSPKFYKINVSSENKAISYAVEEVISTGNKRSKVVGKAELYQPWQFVDFNLLDDDTAPYGKSILYKLRPVFSQLNILEYLLGLSRASKVDRLLIKLPAVKGNLTASLNQLTRSIDQYNNIIFSQPSANTVAGKKQLSLLEKLWTVDGIDISTLPRSGIDLSSVEDVQLFGDKAYALTRLPKGYRPGDEVTDRGAALQAMDLKFARVLIPLSTLYLEYIHKMCECILVDKGFDITKLKIRVELDVPQQLSESELERYGKILSMYRDLKKEEGEDIEKINYTILINLGMNRQLAKLIAKSKIENYDGLLSREESEFFEDKELSNKGRLTETKVQLEKKFLIKENREEILSSTKK